VAHKQRSFPRTETIVIDQVRIADMAKGVINPVLSNKSLCDLIKVVLVENLADFDYIQGNQRGVFRDGIKLALYPYPPRLKSRV